MVILFFAETDELSKHEKCVHYEPKIFCGFKRAFIAYFGVKPPD